MWKFRTPSSPKDSGRSKSAFLGESIGTKTIKVWKGSDSMKDTGITTQTTMKAPRRLSSRTNALRATVFLQVHLRRAVLSVEALKSSPNLVCCSADVLEGKGLVQVAITVTELLRFYGPRSPLHASAVSVVV
ncbi:hypothetical protein HUJ04_005797 [Dendroctonus ponderosae]|nr:hypothetical protein HUJ04_005797 [Dendroctonus ponderosae]